MPFPGLIRLPFGMIQGYVPEYYDKLMMTEIGTGNQLHTFPFHVTRILRDWLCRNLQHPYASPEEKEDLRTQTGLSLQQINYWLTNARRRLVPRLLHFVNQSRAKQGLKPVRTSRCKNKCKLIASRTPHTQPRLCTGLNSPPQLSSPEESPDSNVNPATNTMLIYSPTITPEQYLLIWQTEHHQPDHLAAGPANHPSNGLQSLTAAASTALPISLPPHVPQHSVDSQKLVFIRSFLPGAIPPPIQITENSRPLFLHRVLSTPSLAQGVVISEPPPLEKIQIE